LSLETDSLNLKAQGPRLNASTAYCLLPTGPGGEAPVFRLAQGDAAVRGERGGDVARTRFKSTIDRWMGDRRAPDWELLWLEEFFRERPDAAALDAGCGKKSKLGHFPDARSVGVDADATIFANTDLRMRVIGSVDALPFREAQFDLVYSKYVAEHLPDPVAVWREFHRVLRPGGRLILLTVNRLNYAMIVSAHSPMAFHRWITRLAWGEGAENYPTYYRANSRGVLHRTLVSAGFRRRRVLLFGGAFKYLQFSAPLYLGARLADKLAAISPLSSFKLYLLAEYEK
jgi:SAM-dependent methyltransferase